MARSWIALGVLAAAVSAGCAGSNINNGYNSGANEQADSDAKFEASHNNPITAETRFAAGQLAESEGDAGNAVTQYTAALELDPNYKAALFRLGYVYKAREQYPQAIEIWRRYVRATGGSAEGYSNLGYCLEIAGQKAEAEETYQEGIAKDPANRPCRMNYGLMLARQNRMTEASEQLELVLTPAEVHYNLASVLESQGKKEGARREYAKALQIDPEMGDARARMAAL